MSEAFLFGAGDKDQTKSLAPIFQQQFAYAQHIRLIFGFLTEAGFEQLFGSLSNATEINRIGGLVDFILVGELTEQCADLFDQLYSIPSFKNKLFYNEGLGHVVRKGKMPVASFLANPFTYVIGKAPIAFFGPMIHSKIVAINPDRENNWFYIGSANGTQPALRNDNAEAGIIFKDAKATVRDGINNYIATLKNVETTKPYNPLQNPRLRDIGSTLLIFALNRTHNTLRPGDIIFASLPQKFQSEVIQFHRTVQRLLILFVFSNWDDLLNFRFENSSMYFTETGAMNINPTVGPSETQGVKAILDYDAILPPRLMPLPPKFPKTGPSQMKCVALDVNDPEAKRKYKKSFELFGSDEFGKPPKNKHLDNIIIRKGRPIKKTIYAFSQGTVFCSVDENKPELYGQVIPIQVDYDFTTLGDHKAKYSKIIEQKSGIICDLDNYEDN